MLPARSDEPVDLLPLIAVGDANAVRDVVTRYGRLILSLARRSDPDHVEDAVQEIFVDLWRAAARFDRSKGPEVTFVAMIARRRLIDRARQRRRIPPSLPLSAASSQAGSDSPDVATLAAQTVRALGQLRPEQRDAVVMSVQGWSHAEISKKLGVPLGTAKAFVRRGILAVRAVFATTEEP